MLWRTGSIILNSLVFLGPRFSREYAPVLSRTPRVPWRTARFRPPEGPRAVSATRFARPDSLVHQHKCVRRCCYAVTTAVAFAMPWAPMTRIVPGVKRSSVILKRAMDAFREGLIRRGFRAIDEESVAADMGWRIRDRSSRQDIIRLAQSLQKADKVQYRAPAVVLVRNVRFDAATGRRLAWP